MKPFNDTYVMYQLLEFIDESTIICLCKASKKLNKICKNYIELEDDKRFEVNITKNIHDNSRLLEIYCRNNDVIKIRKMMKMYLFWEWGLHGACQGGHIEIVKLMIEKGASQWNWALSYACVGGHMDIVKLMIDLGGDNWNWGLRRACTGGHIDIIKFLIEKGASWCNQCNKSVEEHLKSKH